MTNDLNGNKFKLSICKCTECNDGYLIVKKIDNPQYDRMLGCTNYTTRHCTNYMLPTNYTQDKNKILKLNDGKVFCSEFKAEVITILNALAEIFKKYPKFRLTFTSLTNFLTGKESKTITTFMLNNIEGYGIYSEKPSYFITKFLNALIDYDILLKTKDEENHKKIELQNINPSDETILEIYKAIKRH